MTTLAEKLRAWVGKAEAASEAQAAEKAARLAAEESGIALLRDARTYLNGHDDAMKECEMRLNAADVATRQAQEIVTDANAQIATLTARVRELEAQPAAVGVVGAVRWGVLEVGDHMVSRVWDKRDSAEHYRHSYPQTGRVVAIVDPAQIVPLASATPMQWRDDIDGKLFYHRDVAALANAVTVTPFYPGLAQPAQEREG